MAFMAFTAGRAAAEPCFQDDQGRIVTRRRPGFVEVPCPRQDAPARAPDGEAPRAVVAPAPAVPVDAPPAPVGASPAPVGARPAPVGAPLAAPGARLPRPTLADYVDAVPLPDRWRIVESLGEHTSWYDPYNRNVLKADRPFAADWFFNLGLVSDTVFELRQLPAPAADTQAALAQNLAIELGTTKGDTVFRPPDFELRFTPVLNYNGARSSGTRSDGAFVGVQAAFLDLHLWNVSDHYDFDRVRVGIQPFSADFRGFLFQDNQLGVRLFGTRANNVLQYNLAWFRRLPKDAASRLNDLRATPRRDDVAVASLYVQDLPVSGFTSQLTAVYNRNREGQARGYDVVYVGYNGDGHLGWLNLTSSVYVARGEESAGTFVPTPTRVAALFAALEASVDFDWIRVRLSGLYGSGDGDPSDDQATGFDAIFENPQFAGADSSTWIRQALPLLGSGVALSGRNGVLASLRPAKDEGRSNFTNPGILLGGVGLDLDVLPTLRLSTNANTLAFDKTAVLEMVRQQGTIPRHLGYDLSAALTWRPLLSQNIVVRASYAILIGGAAWKALFPGASAQYLLTNAIFTY